MLLCDTLEEEEACILIRAFFAIPVIQEDEPVIKAALQPVQQTLVDVVRWIPAKNWHITLRFLGNITTRQVESLSHAADQVANRIKQFACPILKIAGFPSSHAKNVAAVVKPVDELRQIVEALQNAAEYNGLNKDPRRFRPHITLGKFKNEVKEFTANETKTLSINAKELVLFESKLSDKGSQYIPIQRFQFLD